jgi:hypothetical protein
MIALVLLYFVGKAFYDLAGRNNKSQWLFAVLGVVSYYAGIFIGGIIMAIGYELLFDGLFEDVNETLVGFLALPIGILGCWGYYRILKNRWESKETFTQLSEEVLDANQIDRGSENL